MPEVFQKRWNYDLIVNLPSLVGRIQQAYALKESLEELEAAGIEVLMDDRMESPGIKFNDADLLGVAGGDGTPEGFLRAIAAGDSDHGGADAGSRRSQSSRSCPLC